MSDGSQEYTGPSINPIVGGVIGMTPIGNRFMRGYGVASELQMREYERRRKEEERKQLEKALGMPGAQFEGELKRTTREQAEADRKEVERLRTAEAASRGPVQEPFSYGSFRYLAKPPAIPPEVSEPPTAAMPAPYTDEKGQTRMPTHETGETAPVFETPTPSEIEGQGGAGFTERPPTPEEMYTRQTASGVIGAEKAVTEQRKRRDEAEVAAVMTAAERLNLTDEERLQIQSGVANGSGAQARYAIAKVLQNRREATLETESDKAIDLDPDLTPQSKALLKTQPVKSRQALVTQLKEADRKEIYRQNLSKRLVQIGEHQEKALQARIDAATRSNNRQAQQGLITDLRKEAEGYQRAINAADNGIVQLGARMIAEDDPAYVAMKEKKINAQLLLQVTQSALNRLQGATGQYVQPGDATQPGEPTPTGEPPPSTVAPPAAPRPSPPPAVPTPTTPGTPKPKAKYRPGDDPAGLGF